MITKYEKANAGKILAAILVLAMVFAGAAVIMTDSEVSANDATISQSDIDSAEDTYTAAGNLTLGEDITLGEKTINLKGFTLSTAGYNITGGTITGYGQPNEGYNSGFLIYLSGDSVITNTTISMVNNESGKTAAAAIVTDGSGTTTITGCTFTAKATAFGAVQANGTTTFNGCTTNGGYITFKESSQKLTINNNVDDLTLNLVGNITIGSEIFVITGSTVAKTILGWDGPNSNQAQVEGNTKVTVENGNYNLGNVVSGTASTGDKAIDVNEGAKVPADVNSADITVSGDGRIDMTYEDVTLSGTLTSDVNGQANQRIIVTDDLVVSNGVTINVNGQFIVESDASVTFNAGSKIVFNSGSTADIQGDMTIQGGAASNETFVFNGKEMTVSGSVILEGADAFACNGTVKIEGTFEIDDAASANFTQGATVAANGAITVYGAASGAITNNGTITVDSETAISDLTIQMGNGATLNATNVCGTIEVSDSELTYKSSGADTAAKYDTKITLKDVSGVVVTEALEIKADEDGARYGENTMYISGNIDDASTADGEPVAGTVTIAADTGTSNAVIAEATTIGNATLTINGNLAVNAEVNATSDKAKIDGTGAVTVNGKITAKYAMTTKTINAASYRTAAPESYYVYTTLATALSDGATDITVTGTVKIDSDVTIPIGTKVTNSAAMTIGEDATVTISADGRDSGRLINNGTIDVEGTLTAQNYSKSGLKGTITSDTSKASGSSMTYTNVYNAIENAVDGETVEITRGSEITLDKDLTVKAGVTLLIPSGEAVKVGNEVILTVDGTLDVDGGKLSNAEKVTSEPKKDAGKTVVNGMMLYSDASSTDTYKTQIAGAYFGYNGVNAIAPLSVVAGIINDVESNISLYLDMAVGDIAFNYTGTDELTITANNKVTFGNVDLGAVKFIAATGSSVTGTFVLANGTVSITNVEGISIYDKETIDADNNTAYVATFEGSAIKANDGNADTANDKGTISITGTVAIVNPSAGTTDVDAAVELTVPASATLSLVAGTIDNIVIDGTATTTKDTGTVNLTVVTVTGTLATPENKSVSVGSLFAGVYADDILKENVNGTTGAAAIIGDGVAVSKIAYVAPGCTVGKGISDVQYITEYYVEDALFVTAYAAANDVAINDIVANVEHTEFLGWFVEDGKNAIADTVNVGALNYEKVYAHIDYEIYTIDVSAAPGATVYIDGKEWNANTEYSYGDHEITIYLKAGYQGTPEITVNGAKISGTTFQITGDSTEIMVTGVSAIDYSQTGNANENGGMGLVEILLVILVVVVVILAIIVVLRMMRS